MMMSGWGRGRGGDVDKRVGASDSTGMKTDWTAVVDADLAEAAAVIDVAVGEGEMVRKAVVRNGGEGTVGRGRGGGGGIEEVACRINRNVVIVVDFQGA